MHPLRKHVGPINSSARLLVGLLLASGAAQAQRAGSSGNIDVTLTSFPRAPVPSARVTTEDQNRGTQFISTPESATENRFARLPYMASGDDYDDSFDTDFPRPLDLNGRWTDASRKVQITMNGNDVLAAYLAKPDGSKVGCNAGAARGIMPYDNDFHGTVSDDGKTITGQISYCFFDTFKPELTRTEKALVKLKISPDGQTLDGCYKTPYGTGKHTFQLTADYSKIEIRLRIYIPSPAAGLYTPDLANARTVGPNSVPVALLHGDGRSYSYSEGTNRVFQSVTVTVDPSRDSPVVGKKRAWFGESRQYLPTQGAHVPSQPWWWWAINPSEEGKPSYQTRLQRTDDNNKLTVVRGPPEGDGDLRKDKVIVSSKVDAGIPGKFPLNFSPNINSDIVVELRQAVRGTPEFIASGTHDAFPAYELYLNQYPLHFTSPAMYGATPFALITPLHQVTFNQGDIVSDKWLPIQEVIFGTPGEWKAYSAIDICAQVPDVPQVKDDRER
jgi:hypothetical protein